MLHILSKLVCYQYLHTSHITLLSAVFSSISPSSPQSASSCISVWVSWQLCLPCSPPSPCQNVWRGKAASTTSYWSCWTAQGTFLSPNMRGKLWCWSTRQPTEGLPVSILTLMHLKLLMMGILKFLLYPAPTSLMWVFSPSLCPDIHYDLFTARTIWGSWWNHERHALCSPRQWFRGKLPPIFQVWCEWGEQNSSLFLGLGKRRTWSCSVPLIHPSYRAAVKPLSHFSRILRCCTTHLSQGRTSDGTLRR